MSSAAPDEKEFTPVSRLQSIPLAVMRQGRRLPIFAAEIFTFKIANRYEASSNLLLDNCCVVFVCRYSGIFASLFAKA